jgi:hypothetical protein
MVRFIHIKDPSFLDPIFCISYFYYCCEQIPDRNNLRELLTYFDSWFQRVQFVVAWLHAHGRNFMVAGVCVGAAHIIVGRKQRERDERTNTPKVSSSMTHFLQLDPTH